MITASKRGREKEKKDAKLLKGNLTINSGTFWFSKGDFTLQNYLVDSKSCVVHKYSFNIKQWEKLKKQAIKIKKQPMLLIGLGKFDIISKQHPYNVAIVSDLSIDYIKSKGLEYKDAIALKDTINIDNNILAELEETDVLFMDFFERKITLFIMKAEIFKDYFM